MGAKGVSSTFASHVWRALVRKIQICVQNAMSTFGMQMIIFRWTWLATIRWTSSVIELAAMKITIWKVTSHIWKTVLQKAYPAFLIVRINHQSKAESHTKNMQRTTVKKCLAAAASVTPTCKGNSSSITTVYQTWLNELGLMIYTRLLQHCGKSTQR